MKQFVKKASIRRSRKATSQNEEKRETGGGEEQRGAEVAAVAAAAAAASPPPLSPPLMTISDEPQAQQQRQQLFNDSLVVHGQEDDQISTTSSNKPLPGLPESRSSPEIKSKLSANLRQLALSSHASSSLPSSPLAPSNSTFYIKPASSASNASENWTSPEDAEGEYIRRTYAHFDASGIRGDGVIDGKEWTRERGARAAWEASESTTNIEAIHQDHLAPPPAINGHDANRARRSSSPLAKSVETSPRLGEGQDDPLLKSPENVQSGYKMPRSGLAVNDSFGQSTSSLGSHSVESTNVDVRPTQKVATESEEKLEAERRELMKNIDRYGFFHKEGQNSRSRITVMPATSLESIPKRRRNKTRKGGRESKSSTISASGSTDEAYLSTGDDSMTTQSNLQSIMESRDSKDLALREREEIRVAKWDRMLEVKRSSQEASCYVLLPGIFRTKKLRKRVYKGIPDRWRSAAWWAILYGQTSQNSLFEAEHNYKQLLSVASPHDVQIDLDVPRTISGHVLFHTRYGQGQRSLFHVLHAFSMLCPKCAYCQGMGPIVATLLVYFTPEKAYAVMVELHNRSLYGLHSTFSPGFPGLVENFYVQKKLCEKLCPDVIESLESNGIVISSYATKWYITLFTNVLPFSTQLRLWDCFLLQGKDLLVVVAIAILWSLRNRLTSGGFERSMNLLTREFLPVDDDALLNWIFVVMEREDTRKRIREARNEYRSLVKQGKEPIL